MAPVTTLGQYWIAAPNTAGTNALAATGFLGTSSNNHMDLVSNNIVRGRRLSNLRRIFYWYNKYDILAGDLMNGVCNATFPWAVNGYSPILMDLVTYGSSSIPEQLIFAGVQGEYYGTNTSMVLESEVLQVQERITV